MNTAAQIITAPSEEKPKYVSLFLAGGITNCKDWQSEVIEELKNRKITIFNPRRENFDIGDIKASYDQIRWEFNRLQLMSMFTMYFCDSKSDQPICMYELGRNILNMQIRFPDDWEKRIVVSVEKGYRRGFDVLIQLGFCARRMFINTDATPSMHAKCIEQMIIDLGV